MAVETAKRRAARVALLPEPSLGGRPIRKVDRSRGTGGGVLVVAQQEHVRPGRLLDVLGARGFAPVVTGAGPGDALPDPASLHFAVVIGTEVNVEDVTRAWSPEQSAWLRAADEAGTPVLALGAGAEALAVALGGAVSPARRAQHGWIEVVSAAPRLVATGPWLAWSENAIELPSRARMLAFDATGPKAFRIGRHLAVHAHPHATPKLASDWVAQSRLPVRTDALGGAAQWRGAAAAAERLFGGFLESVR